MKFRVASEDEARRFERLRSEWHTFEMWNTGPGPNGKPTPTMVSIDGEEPRLLHDDER